MHKYESVDNKNQLYFNFTFINWGNSRRLGRIFWSKSYHQPTLVRSTLGRQYSPASGISYKQLLNNIIIN